MATDYLVLGGVVFDEWSTPENLPFGGKQALKVHKLPGGSRVIDLLGPDENDIRWSGKIWSDSAPAIVAALDGMRISGQPVSLSFAGNSRVVIVETFVPTVVRFPQYYTYEISCTVSSNPMAGGLGGIVSSFAALVGSDMASALSVIGL